VSVALDSGGPAAVRDFIRPAEPIQMMPEIQDIMGWDNDLVSHAGTPTYPNLIDEKHIVAELYNITNVPMAVWIDEEGRIVRPAESAGASDGFRSMDRATFKMTSEAAAGGKSLRTQYVNALRDWVAKGSQSAYALAPEEAAGRIAGPSATDALSSANFRLAQYLHQRGHTADAMPYFLEARRLCPERWHYLRQTLEIEEAGKGSGPEFFAAIDALGERSFYHPADLKAAAK
jgi:hypothetical protein